MTDPLTLSELVPAQTLAKALLEAEEALIEAQAGLKWYQGEHPEDDSEADNEMHEKIDQALAQIQRLKTGEM